MTKLTLAVPSVGEKNTVAEPKVDIALKRIEEWANGEVGTANITAEAITEAMLAKGLQEKLVTNVGLTYATSAVSLEGVSGKFYDMSGAGTTLTLPKPIANRLIGVFNNSVGAAVKVKASEGKIYGDFTEEVTEVSLTLRQHLLLFGSGGYWLIIAGEPKREQTYTAVKNYSKAEMEAGVEPSASRTAVVEIVGGITGLTVAGVSVEGVGPYFVMPGQKIKTTVADKLQWILL